MQQPGLQQTPAGWPGMPGLQAPFSQAQPQAAHQSAHGYPSHTYQVQPYPAPSVQPGQFQPSSQPQFQAQPQFQFQPQFQLQPQAQPAQYPPSYPPQYQTQTQAQVQPSPQQPQAAPVTPVSPPASPYSSGAQPGSHQGQQNPAQAQAQAVARQLIEVARTLEQLIPGYQIAQSVLLELSPAPSTQQASGHNEAIESLRDALYSHGACLGTIRRLLCGETTPAVLSNLVVAFHSLSQAHTRSRPLLERVTAVAPLSQRGSLTSLNQMLTQADSLLGQVGSTIQTLVGPHLWEAARPRTPEKATAERAAVPARSAT